MEAYIITALCLRAGFTEYVMEAYIITALSLRAGFAQYVMEVFIITALCLRAGFAEYAMQTCMMTASCWKVYGMNSLTSEATTGLKFTLTRTGNGDWKPSL